MSKITNIISKNSLIVEVNHISTIDSLQRNYDCFMRPDIGNECILDLTCIDSEEDLKYLCDLLEIEIGSDHADLLYNSGYTVFFC
jgi:hypothetical protein